MSAIRRLSSAYARRREVMLARRARYRSWSPEKMISPARPSPSLSRGANVRHAMHVHGIVGKLAKNTIRKTMQASWLMHVS